MSNKNKVASLEKKPGKVIGFKIENDRPEDDPAWIATELADSLSTESSARNDSIAFREQAQRERQKAQDLTNVLFQIEQYKKDKKEKLKKDPDWGSKKPWEGGPSRMDPWASYDEEAVKTQRLEILDQARNFDDLSNEYAELAKKEKLKQSQLQKKLRTAHKKKK